MKTQAGKRLFFLKLLCIFIADKCQGIKLKTIILLTTILLYYFGAFTHFFELNYYGQFSYPLDINITNCIERVNNVDTYDKCSFINHYNYTYVLNKPDKCTLKNGNAVRLVIMVKSAGANNQRRMAIRKSWGYERRFSDVLIRTVFMLGSGNYTLNHLIGQEHAQYGDIIQADFFDTYYNNTFKSMMALDWATSFCRNARFYLLVDDDMYVSVRNVLLFLRHPTGYPHYNHQKIADYPTNNDRRYIYNLDLPENVNLYAGSITVAAPHRHLCSKWYVSLNEYQFHLYPPYASGGAIILSRRSLEQFHYANYFTKPFKFDDVYLGILAKKVNIEPFHSDHFHMFKLPYRKYNYNHTMVVHGYGNSDELLRVWSEQKNLGYA